MILSEVCNPPPSRRLRRGTRKTTGADSIPSEFAQKSALMRRLFDTNAVIALQNDDMSKPAQRALRETPGEMAVSALVVHELFYGALKSRRAPQNVTLTDAIGRQNSRFL